MPARMSLVMSSDTCPSGTRAVEVEGAGPPCAMIANLCQIVKISQIFDVFVLLVVEY